jgi:hypothetical protein
MAGFAILAPRTNAGHAAKGLAGLAQFMLS